MLLLTRTHPATARNRLAVGIVACCVAVLVCRHPAETFLGETVALPWAVPAACGSTTICAPVAAA